jgi:hypothetical protein
VGGGGERERKRETCIFRSFASSFSSSSCRCAAAFLASLSELVSEACRVVE